MVISITMSLVTMLFLTLLIYNFGYILIESIVTDKEICALAFQNLRVYCIFYIIDGIQVELQSVIKALGQQDRIQLFTVVNYFIVGQGFAYTFGIRMEMGIDGLWYGLGLGITMNAIGYASLLMKVDWQEIANKCQSDMQDTIDGLQESTDFSDFEQC